MKKILLIAASALAFMSCSKDNAYTLSNNGASCDTAAVSYVNSIAVIMQANCNGCHSGSSASAGIKTNSYADLSALSNGRLLGCIKHESGYKAMPQGAPKITDCEINKITAWINQGKLNN